MFKLGADPEVFVYDDKEKDYISGHNLIPGTKEEPHRVKYGAVQVDGVALEFNIDPATNRKEFLRNINTVYNKLQKMVSRKGNSFHLSCDPSVLFDQKYFDTIPEFNKMLGCQPDYNAYTGEENPKPHTDKPFRTASGHIHIGWAPDGVMFEPYSKEHFTKCRDVVSQLDAILYPSSLLFDSDNERRTLYGAPGSFRPKVYGVEYRVLSNSWIQHDDLILWVYDTTIWALNELEKGNKFLLKNLNLDWLQVVNHYHFLVDRGMPSLPDEHVKNHYLGVKLI